MSAVNDLIRRVEFAAERLNRLVRTSEDVVIAGETLESALRQWRERPALRDDASLYDACFDAARECRDGYPIRAVLEVIDAHVLGRAATLTGDAGKP
jgi:hypothetical protein